MSLNQILNVIEKWLTGLIRVVQFTLVVTPFLAIGSALTAALLTTLPLRTVALILIASAVLVWKRLQDFPPRLSGSKKDFPSLVKATSWTCIATTLAIVIFHGSEMLFGRMFSMPMYQFGLGSVAMLFVLRAIDGVLPVLKINRGLILMVKTTERALALMRRKLEDDDSAEINSDN